MTTITHVDGLIAPGFEEVRAEFERNFAERGEIGAAVAAYWRGKKVVDLWGGRRTPEGNSFLGLDVDPNDRHYLAVEVPAGNGVGTARATARAYPGSPGAGGSFAFADPDAHLGYAYGMNSWTSIWRTIRAKRRCATRCTRPWGHLVSMPGP